MARLTHSLLALALLLVPSVAAACPACLGQQSTFTTTLKLLGVMILFPFPVVYLVIRAIRKASRELEEPPVVPPPDHQ